LGHGSGELSSAALFTLLRDALADLLGGAAAATLLRRAVRRASLREPELADLMIIRERLQYRYTLPSAWSDVTSGVRPGFQHLVGELLPLLVELTGPVVIGHLAQIPELRERGIVSLRKEAQ
jgi:hypothetical protein